MRVPRALRRPGAAFPLALLLGACAGDPVKPVLHQLAGDWRLIEHLEGTGSSVVCNDTATVAVAQQGPNLTLIGGGNVHCRWATGDSLDTWIGYATTATLDGHTFTIPDAVCPYIGTVNSAGDQVSGTVDCPGSALSVSGRVTGEWRLVKGDFGLPTVAASIAPPNPTHGDTLVIAVTALDASLLVRVGVQVEMQGITPSDGTCPPPDTVVGDSLAVSADSVEHTFRIAVLGCTGSVAVTSFAVDSAGNRGLSNAFLPVRLPVATITAALSDTVYALGDSARVTITALNPDGLSWIGVRWSHQAAIGQESVAVSGTGASHSFAVRIPPGDPPYQVTATVFARHRLGYATTLQLPAARTTDAILVPVQSLWLTAMPTDWAWSPKRDRVYVALRYTTIVREIGLAPLTALTSYPLTTYGTSLDLTAGEDSLVVGRAGPLAVAIVPLTGGATTDITITPPDVVNTYDVRRVRIVEGGRVLVGVGSGGAGSIQELMLGTLSQRTRVPWAGYGTFERAARARLLIDDGGSPVTSRLYLAATDTFLPEQSGLLHGYAPVSDTAGTRWLVGTELWDADLAFLRGIGGGAEPPYTACALAPDAARAFCPRGDGYTEYDAATGLKVRAIHLPVMPNRILPLGANRVMAWRDSTLYLVTVP